MKSNAVISRISPYRVFISYSHKDEWIVRRIAGVLEDQGLEVMWDRNFAYGSGFHEQIRLFIAHSDVFLPVITKQSSMRGWVHQEIGYAFSQNIPVLPLAIKQLPDAMMRELHAIVLPKKRSKLKKELNYLAIENLVRNYQNPANATFQCAALTEDRALMLTRYANDVRGMGKSDLVRQKGGLSSFHIPDEVITDKIWKDRYGQMHQTYFHCRSLREERLALENHAFSSGCRLIINPELDYKKYGTLARVLRLSWFLKFLHSPAGMNTAVALDTSLDKNYSLTLVGDWFSAESTSAGLGQGFRQTIFTRHAPSIRGRIDLFDQEFENLIEKRGWTMKNSRIHAEIEILKKIEHLVKELSGDEQEKWEKYSHDLPFVLPSGLIPAPADGDSQSSPSFP